MTLAVLHIQIYLSLFHSEFILVKAKEPPLPPGQSAGFRLWAICGAKPTLLFVLQPMKINI
jgi:hypothetical protein